MLAIGDNQFSSIQGVQKVFHHPENTFIVTDAQVEHHFQWFSRQKAV